MPDLTQKKTRRVVVMSALAALCAAVVVASVAVHPARVRGALASDARVVENVPGATSVMWSCAGPLPVGSTTELSSIELSNSAHVPVVAKYAITTNIGARSGGVTSVPSGAVVVLRPPVVTKPGFAAARVVAEGAGLNVVEIVHGPQGPDTAECVHSVSTTAYLVAGDTHKTDDVTLSLYDPGATPAVASVSVATLNGVQSPAALQGLPIGAGQMVTYSIGQRVPFVPELAITVRSSAGSLVVGGLSSARIDKTTINALEPGIVDPSPSWLFAAAPAGPSAAQTVDLLNPSRKAASVAVTDSTSGGTAHLRVIVPPGEVARVALPTESATRALGSVEVLAAKGVPVVAARTTIVGAVIPAAQLPERNPTLRARRALNLVARTPVGYTVTNGAQKAATRWVVGGGEQDRSNSTELVVTNPNTRSANVTIRPTGSKVAWISGLVVSGDTTAVVNVADLQAATGRFALDVDADVPVIATGTIYARGSTGFTSPAAIPLD